MCLASCSALGKEGKRQHRLATSRFFDFYQPPTMKARELAIRRIAAMDA
jgi:hypothetical protein